MSDGARLVGDPPTHLVYAGLAAAGLRHAFTTRHHGSFDSASAPRGPFPGADGPALRALGIEGRTVRVARQVHGTAALIADHAPPGLVGSGDALITTAPGLPLAVFTADCVAVVLGDPVAGVLAVAHAGWRGTVGGILGRLVETLARGLLARPERLRVAIGPSIGPCCYEVDAPVVLPLRGAFPGAAHRWLTAGRPGRFMLDLWQASTDQLVAAGVPAGHIENARLCTRCRGDLFFSYRREGAGCRLAALAVLGPPG